MNCFVFFSLSFLSLAFKAVQMYFMHVRQLSMGKSQTNNKSKG